MFVISHFSNIIKSRANNIKYSNLIPQFHFESEHPLFRTLSRRERRRYNSYLSISESEFVSLPQGNPQRADKKIARLVSYHEQMFEICHFFKSSEQK